MAQAAVNDHAGVMVFRPALRPGARVVRHDARRLRIGQWRRVLIDDRPGLVPLLGMLDGVRDVERIRALLEGTENSLGDHLDEVLDELGRHGALVDASNWPGGIPRDEIAHAALTGRDPGLLRGRRSFALAVDAAASCRGIEDLLRPILDLAGLRSSGDDIDLVMVVSHGDTGRHVFDAAHREGLSTLPVVLTDGRVQIGPWTHPGVTPCIRCADLARSRWDPGALGDPLGPPMTGHGVGALLTQAAVSLIATDVLSGADGRRPRSVGQRLIVGPDPHALAVETVPFSAQCGCHLLGGPPTDGPVS